MVASAAAPPPGGAAGSGHAPADKALIRVSEEPPPDADKFEQLPVDEKLKDDRGKINVMLRNGFQPGDEQVFDNYYTKYAFPRWTLPGNLASLPAFRKELSDESRPVGDGADVRTRLNKVALDMLSRLASGKYHPSVRTNAMLAIGTLLTQASGATAGRSAQQPYPQALPVMVEAVKSAEQIDAVKVAALVGILRHIVSGSADPQYREQEIVPTMLTLATTKVSPGRSSAGHAWMRARAIEVLGEIGSPGNGNSVITGLVEIAGNSDTPFLTRCAAARALGQLVYPANASLNATVLGGDVARLAADALAFEGEQKPPDFDALLQVQRSGPTMPAVMPGLGGSLFGGSDLPAGRPAPTAAPQATPDHARIESEVALQIRRRLGERVESSRRALSGQKDGERLGLLGLAKQPPQKEFIDTAVKRLDAIMALCEEDRLAYPQLMERIRSELTNLRTVLDTAPAEAGAAGGNDKAAASGKAEAKAAKAEGNEKPVSQ